MNKNKVINICIASPGDIILERKIAREVCLGMNDGLLPNDLGVTFNVTIWEYVFPTEDSPQAIMDRLVSNCDIFLCIFHKKYYTSSNRDEPSALEKFLSTFDLWEKLKKPHFLFFFKDITISSLKDIQDQELISLLELKDKIENSNSMTCKNYSLPQDFCEKVNDHLQNCLSEEPKATSI